MADLIKSIKKQNYVETCAQIPTKLYKANSSANLCETRQFSKSLVNWCRDNGDEYWQTATKLCGEFPNCFNVKSHRSSINLFPNPRRERNKGQAFRSNVTIKRNNGLSFFVGADTEQFKKSIEDLTQDNKEKAQNQNSNAATSTATNKLFTNHGNGIISNFKHFADAENVVSEYINFHIYNRTRLGKVDKKKVSASIIALHNIQKDSFKEFNETETGVFRHSEKPSNNILKLERCLPTIKFAEERSMATNNFIFELGALDAANLQNNKRIHQTSSIDVKLMDPKKKIRQRTKKSTSLLPKLHFNELQAIDLRNREANDGVVAKNKALPDISSRKKKETRRDINVKDLPNAKSNWQLLKQRRNLTQGKDCLKSKNLCERLGKIPDWYSYQKIDDNSLKDVFNPLIKVKRELLLPEEIRSEITNGNSSSSKYLEQITKSGKDFGKNLAKFGDRNTSNKSLRKNICADKKTGNESRIENEGRLKNLKKREPKALKSEVEKYLEKYSLTLEDEIINSREEKTVSYPSSDAVVKMLARLNIHDVGFHINVKKGGESMDAVTSPRKVQYFETQNEKNRSNNDHRFNFEANEVRESETGSKLRPIKQECKTLSNVEQSCATNQTDKIATRNKSNTFVKMGLDSLGEKIPKHLSSQILKSEFLNKDLSFKYSAMFNNSLNFKSILNSCTSLSFNFDLSKGDKWLHKKIQTIVKSGLRNRLKGESASRSVAKLHEIVDKKLTERKSEKNFMEITRQSFAQKFLKLHNKILEDAGLRAILPDLVDGIENYTKIHTR